MTTARSSFDQAKSALDKVDPNDAAAVARHAADGVRLAGKPLEDPGPDDGLQDNPELKKAAAQAPNCQTLAKNS